MYLPTTILRLPSWLGDFVMVEPVVRAAHAQYFRAGVVERLTLMAPAAFLPLIAESYAGLVRTACEQRESPQDYRGYERALFFNGSLRSVWAAWRAGVRERIGWRGNARSPWLTLALQRARERGRRPIGWGSEPLRRSNLPRPFGADCQELALQAGIVVEYPDPQLSVARAARVQVAERCRAAGWSASDPRWIVLNVGHRPASAKGAPAELWVRLARELLAAQELPLVLLAGPGEEAALQTVAAQLSDERVLAVLDPPALLPELAAWAEGAELFLCSDGGARHVAKAVGAATLVLFGPTDPRHTAQALLREELVLASVPCSPCHREHCPLSGELELRCMRSHDPLRLAQRVLAHLQRERQRRLQARAEAASAGAGPIRSLPAASRVPAASPISPRI